MSTMKASEKSMSYISKLKKHTHIGRMVFTRFTYLKQLIIFTTLMMLLFTTFAVFIFHTDTPYPAFANDFSVNKAASITPDLLYEIVESPSDNATYCMFFKENNCGVILVDNAILDSELRELLDRSLQSSHNNHSQITLKGKTKQFDTSFLRFVSHDDFLRRFSDDFGTVYLDTREKVYPPSLMPITAVDITFILLSVTFSIILSAKEIRFVSRLSHVDRYTSVSFENFDREIREPYNLSLSKNITLTENYLIDVKRMLFIPINSILWCYLTEKENGSRVIRSVSICTDRKKYKFLKQKCNKRTICPADVLFDVLKNRGSIPIIGYDENSESAYKARLKASHSE